MKKLLSFFITLLFATKIIAASAVGVYDLKVENLNNPFGIDITAPRFSWKTSSDKKNTVQKSYQILIASSWENLNQDNGDLWNSGIVLSDNQLWISYSGKKLRCNQQVYWKIRVETNKGNSGWSKEQTFSVGLLGESDWKGRWIGLETMQPGEQRGMHTRLAARYFRKDYKLKGTVKHATAYVVGLGLYEFYVNGNKIGDNHVLQPVPSDYNKSIYYNTYDITNQLSENTCLGITVGNGRFFPMRQEKAYKTPIFGLPKCRINVVIEYANGQSDTWSTDQSWRLSTNGPIRSNNEYDGEEYDARQELIGWNKFGYDDRSWMPAERCDIPNGTLKAQMTDGMTEKSFGQPIKCLVKSSKNLSSVAVLDFGQNMAGWIGVKVRGNAGDTIRIRYAEKINDDGTIYRDNLRNAFSEDIYVCNGKETGTEWRSRFSYHGFRYAEVSGMKKPTKNDFCAYTVGDEMATVGCDAFVTSDTILNKVVRNSWWGIKGNYKGMPVDCPQRNERQPWLGDRTVGCLGESFLFDNERLYNKWMNDIVDGQRSDGAISNVTPTFWRYFEDNMSWPAVFPFACDMLYNQYGNEQPIKDCYPSIKKWLMYMLDRYESNGIITKDKYGDWCIPPEKLTITHSNDPKRQTDGSLISTAYGIHILQIMEKFANMQNLDADASFYSAKRNELTKAFNEKYLTIKRGTSLRPGHILYPDSVFYGNNTATANLLSLAFGIVPDSIKKDVVCNLVTNIMTGGDGHITCGVIGISWLMEVLSDNGFADVAWLLATNKTYPSWGYMAENGATTVWELWNGDKANPSMNSGNHVMLIGDLLTWCYKYLGGICNDSAGYKHFILKPSFEIQDCFNVDASFNSYYGEIKSKWSKTLQKLHWEITVPVNTTASVYLPDGQIKEVGSGSYVFDVAIPTRNSAIIKDEFLYDFASFPQAHASTIVELKNGDLLASYFGGTKERNPDVCIWVSRKEKGSDIWSKPMMVADGTTDFEHNQLSNSITPRKACWNPVLFQMPNGEVWLFFKIGADINDWQGWVVKSSDGGKTWSKREMLPSGFLGPIKNKPVLIDNRLLCGSSTEKNGWKFHVEIYDLDTKKWKYVGPVKAEEAIKTDDNKEHPIDCIQPSILKLKDGRLKVLMRTHNGFLAQSYSSDKGDTWSDVTLSEIPNNQSGTDAVTLKDGRQALIYNNFQTLNGTKKGPRTPLSIALSDDGEHWHHAITLEDSPISQYSYPAIIQGKDGKLHCVYTWRRQRIAYKEIDLKQLK